MHKKHNLIIIGAGNLGQALANYVNFERRGFLIKGIFDIAPEHCNENVRGFKIHSMDEMESFIKENDIDISYYEEQVTKAINAINKYGSFERFIDLSRPYEPPIDYFKAEQKTELEMMRHDDADDSAPWDELPPVVPCGDPKYNTCLECPRCKDDVCKSGYSLTNYI